MVISVASFLRDNPVVLDEENECTSSNEYDDCIENLLLPDSMQSREDIAAAAAIAAGQEVDEQKKYTFRSKRKRQRNRQVNNVVRYGTRLVKQVSQEESNDEDDCKEAALRLLDYSPRSVEDMNQRLVEKGYSQTVVDAVIQRLLELHLLDDVQYAQTVIRSCVSRMLGTRATRIELQRKHVDSAAIEQCIAIAQDEGVFTEAAWELGRKASYSTRKLEPHVRKRRFFASAARKGHDLGIINEVYESLFTNNEDE